MRMENFRELRYNNIKKDCLFRGESLFNLSDVDKEFFANSKIKTIVDLRMPEEVSQEPDVEIVGIKNIKIPLIHSGDMKRNPGKQSKPIIFGGYPFPDMADIYRLFVGNKEAWTNIFNTLLEKDGGLMFHCTSGKDRTGVVSALILTLLGVDKETIYNDYLLTNKHIVMPNAYIQFMETLDEQSKEDFISYSGAKKEYLDAAFDEINRMFGTIDNFYKEHCSLDEEKITAIRNKYLSL